MANLLDNPALAVGAAADPFIPYGWTNSGLDAGDTEQEAVGGTCHSGQNCLQWNTGSVAGEKITQQITIAIGKFFTFGGWTYGDGSAGFKFNGVNAVLQANPAVSTLNTPHTAAWTKTSAVWRATAANPTMEIEADSGATGSRFTADLIAKSDDDVSLTVTPASAANSVESGGIRVDGWDASPQPIPAGRLFALQGWTRIRYLPRHNGADALKFGSATPYIADWYGDVNNYFYVYWSAASTMTLAFKSAGGALQTGNWATAGAILAGGNYLLEVRYMGNTMYLYVDNVLRVTIASPIAFTTIPAFVYPASANTLVAGQHDDAVFLAP